MATKPVDREALVEQVTQLATDHADLQEAVREALKGLRSSTGLGDATLHVDGTTMRHLRRLTGSP